MRKALIHAWALRRAILFYGVLIGMGWFLGDALRGVVVPEVRPMNEPMIHRMVMSALAAYVVTAAIPFVPGAEIGFGLLVAFGGKAAPVVYAGMVGALVLSYSVARLVPAAMLVPALNGMGLERAAALARRIDATPKAERLDLLAGHLPERLSRTALSNRYLLLALLINTPGNSLLGGGGGLAFAAGLSRLYAFVPFVLTVVLAVCPIPLAFWLF